jgi:hypothetical protein
MSNTRSHSLINIKGNSQCFLKGNKNAAQTSKHIWSISISSTNDKQANIHIQDIAKQATGEGHG